MVSCVFAVLGETVFIKDGIFEYNQEANITKYTET